MARWCRCKAYVLVTAMALLSPAYADLNQARAALDANNYPVAIALADNMLELDPGDLGALFVKGRALVQQGQTEDALSVFESIVARRPDVAAAWNNIGRLRANLGQPEAALSALNNAIRLDRDYALARHNLGDIHAALAKQAYAKAKRLGFASAPTTQDTDARMAGLDPGRQLIGAKIDSREPQSGDTGRTTAVALDVAAPDDGAQGWAPVWSVKANNTDRPLFGKDAEAGRPSASVSPKQPPATPAEKPTPSSASEAADVRQALASWARAWSNQDVTAYLDAYSANFQPANGHSLAAWKKQRRRAVSAPARISITLKAIDIQIESDTRAIVTFDQRYESNTYADEERKQLTFVREKDGWRIVRES